MGTSCTEEMAVDLQRGRGCFSGIHLMPQGYRKAEPMVAGEVGGRSQA